MSNDKEKLKTKAKRRCKYDTNRVTASNQLLPKSRTISKLNVNDGIAKSKQLAKKMKTNPGFGRPRTSKTTKINSNNNEPRICGNGKPMPSLADLEKMFDDSDDDDPQTNNTTNTSTKHNLVGCSTPKKSTILTEDKLKSPSTIKTIADKMLSNLLDEDFISNLPDASILLDDGPPPPVIPPKKRKKTEIPYIVGCKDRAKVPSRPTVNFCKGYDNYGVDQNSNSDEDEDKPRAKRSKVPNISKSIFNANSDEIAAYLKEYDSPLSDGSNDSNKTVAYEYYTPNNSSKQRSFSPLPSTSKDSETIQKNDIRFNESLIEEQFCNKEIQNDLEIINQPTDTIVIGDEMKPKKFSPIIDTSLIVIDDNDSPPDIVQNDETDMFGSKPQDVDDDACIEIRETKPTKIDDSPIPIDDFYSSLDFTDPKCTSEIIEVIDVDDVIAESNAIIEKYRKTDDLNSVTLVEPQTINILASSENAENRSDVDTTEPVISVEEYTITQNTPPVNNTANMSRQPTSDIEYIPSTSIEDTSAVEFVSSTPNHNISSVETTFPRPNIPPVNNLPNTQNEEDGGDVLLDFFRNSNRCQPDTVLLQCSQESSTCNSHNYQKNTMCLLSFIKSMNDIAKKYNKNSTRKKNNKTRNVQPPAMGTPVMITPPMMMTSPMIMTQTMMTPTIMTPPMMTNPPTSQTENTTPPTSKGLGDCPICMESLATTQVASTICGHIFCMKCIHAAIKSSGKRCPNCRKALKGVGYHPLFL